MKVIKDFFPQNTIDKIQTFVEENRHLPIWHTNSAWISRIKKHSSQVSCLDITEKFSEDIKKIFVEYNNKFINYTFVTLYYEWNRGSYIPCHIDSNHIIAATLYLNKDWDIEDGGIFMYYENNNDDNLKCIFPKYNSLVLSERNEIHHVSLINYHAKEVRKTVQIWINKKKYQYN